MQGLILDEQVSSLLLSSKPATVLPVARTPRTRSCGTHCGPSARSMMVCGAWAWRFFGSKGALKFRGPEARMRESAYQHAPLHSPSFRPSKLLPVLGIKARSWPGIGFCRVEGLGFRVILCQCLEECGESPKPEASNPKLPSCRRVRQRGSSADLSLEGFTWEVQ